MPEKECRDPFRGRARMFFATPGHAWPVLIHCGSKFVRAASGPVQCSSRVAASASRRRSSIQHPLSRELGRWTARMDEVDVAQARHYCAGVREKARMLGHSVPLQRATLLSAQTASPPWVEKPGCWIQMREPSQVQAASASSASRPRETFVFDLPGEQALLRVVAAIEQELRRTSQG